MSGAAVDAPTVGPRARAVLADHDRLEVHDLYSPQGAPVYEAIAGHDTAEIREIVARTGTTQGPILELAAGAGRITLPLLTLRRAVVATDLSRPMLDLLAAKLAQLPEPVRARCTLVEGDMVQLRLAERFGAVVIGTSSVSLLADATARASLLDRVRAHLRPGGRLILTTVEPATGTPGGEDVFEMDVDGRRLAVYEWMPPGATRRVVTVVPTAHEGPVLPVLTSSVGVVPADLLADELAAAGFEVVDRHELTTGRYRDTVLVAGLRDPR